MAAERKGWAEAIRGGLIMAVVLTAIFLVFGERRPLVLAGYAVFTAVVFTPFFHHLETKPGGPSPLLMLAVGVAGLALNGYVLIAHPPRGWDWAPWVVVVGIAVWLVVQGIAELRRGAGAAHDGG